MKIHIVQKGDTLYQLAKKYNVELEQLIAANPIIHDPDDLVVGLKVKIPTKPTKVIHHYEKNKQIYDKQLEHETKSDHPFLQQPIPAEKVGSFYDLPDLADMDKPSWNIDHDVTPYEAIKPGPTPSPYNVPIYPGNAYVPYSSSEYPGLNHSSQYPVYPTPTLPFELPQNPIAGYGPMSEIQWEYPETPNVRANDSVPSTESIDMDNSNEKKLHTSPTKKTSAKVVVKHDVKKKSIKVLKQPIERKKSSPLLKY